MAIYEYQCADCQTTFTVSEPISRHARKRARPTCPECKGKNTIQLFSSFYAKTSSKA